jgi:hypothetical protein
MRDDEALATFQEALLELLDSHESPEAVLRALAAREELLPFRDYVSTFDVRSVAVAMDLVKKWGVRDG